VREGSEREKGLSTWAKQHTSLQKKTGCTGKELKKGKRYPQYHTAKNHRAWTEKPPGQESLQALPENQQSREKFTPDERATGAGVSGVGGPCTRRMSWASQEVPLRRTRPSGARYMENPEVNH